MSEFMTTGEIQERKKMRNKILYLLAIVFALLIGSAVVYSHLEGWGFLDSIYFTTTLATVGSGNMYPTTSGSKLFTIFFALIVVAILLYALSTLGMYYLRYIEDRRPALKDNLKKTVKKLSFKSDPDKWVDIYRIRKK